MFNQSEELERIIAECGAALAKNPKNLKAYISRAFAYGEMHDYDKAIMDLTKAIGLCPRDKNLYYNRACHYLIDKNENRKAIRDFSKVIKLNPEDTAAYTNRGVAYAKMGDFDSAIDDFLKALELSPDNNDIRKYCATAYLEKGEYDSALNHFIDARERDPEDPGTYLHIGLIALRKGDREEAVKNLKLSADYESPEAIDELNTLGVPYVPQKRISGAKRTYWGKL